MKSLETTQWFVFLKTLKVESLSGCWWIGKIMKGLKVHHDYTLLCPLFLQASVLERVAFVHFLTDFHVLSQKHSDSTEHVNSSEYTSLEFLKGLSNNPGSKGPFPNFYNDNTN